MKASIALVLASSLLAAAGPIKRAVHTAYVTDLVYVTVTVDPETATPTHTTHRTTTLKKTTTASSTKTTTTSSTSSTPPPPPPTTSSTKEATTSSTTQVPQVHTITLTEGAEPTTTQPTTTETPAPTTTTAAAAQQAAAETPVAVESSTAAQSTTAEAASAEPTDFASTAVYHHNIHRTNHSAPAVSWDSDLASYAATAAASCVFAHNLSPGSSTGAYGQNIAVYGASGDVESISSSTIIAQAITNMWYDGEVWQFPSSDYGESTPDMTNFESWGHFSQVVWVASTEIGCAAQYCKPGTIYSDLGSWFSVCNYRSEGNMGGAYGTNVLPPLGESTVTA